MRYYMLDRILEYTHGESARAIKNITLSDDVLSDHFPDLPIYPGAFVVESAAQLSGFLLEMTCNTPTLIRRAMMAQIDQAKFYRPAEPGDQLLLEAQLDSVIDDAAKIRIHVSSGKEKVARAILTFVLKEVEWEKIHDQRRSLYRIWTRHIENFPEIL